MSSKTEFNKTKDIIVQVLCITCKNQNRHKVLTSLDCSGSEPMGYDNTYDWNAHYQIIECQGCGSISFRDASSNSEDFDFEDGYYIAELIYQSLTKTI